MGPCAYARAGTETPTEKLLIWVEAAQDGEFVIDALEDSANDLRGKIKGKFWEQAASREGAHAVILVTNRYSGDSGIRETTYNHLTGGVQSYDAKLRVVEVQLIVNDKIIKEFFGECPVTGFGGEWKAAANQAKKAVEQFLKDNHAKILELAAQ